MNFTNVLTNLFDSILKNSFFDLFFLVIVLTSLFLKTSLSSYFTVISCFRDFNLFDLKIKIQVGNQRHNKLETRSQKNNNLPILYIIMTSPKVYKFTFHEMYRITYIIWPSFTTTRTTTTTMIKPLSFRSYPVTKEVDWVVKSQKWEMDNAILRSLTLDLYM